jgi:uncharacterized LabA/DUF88 family protein
MSTRRIALYLDIENLIHDLRRAGELEEAEELITGLVHSLDERGVVVVKVAACDTSAARRLAFALARSGVRFFPHREATADAADLDLIEMITQELPKSVDTVVIASGDHIFADVVDDLRRRGVTVIIAARTGTLSWRLARSASEVLVVGDRASEGRSLLGVL